MDLLMETGAIKLKSHLKKFLVADEASQKVRQNSDGSTNTSIWVVEPSPVNPDAVRLKNLSTSLYLTASDTKFLTGMTGKLVVQLSICDPTLVDWEPINDGSHVKFRSTKERQYLRANGATYPWRNKVTHDAPLTGATSSWLLWTVEPISLTELESAGGVHLRTLNTVPSTRTGMDLFRNAKTVRLKSAHDKYLYAMQDQEALTQGENGASRNATWTVELVGNRAIRLRSCFGNYLTSSNEKFLLGWTGKKATQMSPTRLDSSTEWIPERVGSQVMLRSRYGNFLRANGALFPWRNSVTHDLPHRTATQDWVVWDVDVVETTDNLSRVERMEEKENLDNGNPGSDPGPSQGGRPGGFKDEPSLYRGESSSIPVGKESDRSKKQESSDFGAHPLPNHDGRRVTYRIADEHDANVSGERSSFIFKGHNFAELVKKLEKETGLQDFLVCSPNPYTKTLYPIRLQLPPNQKPMDIVVVPSTSKLGRQLSSSGLT